MADKVGVDAVVEAIGAVDLIQLIQQSGPLRAEVGGQLEQCGGAGDAVLVKDLRAHHEPNGLLKGEEHRLALDVQVHRVVAHPLEAGERLEPGEALPLGNRLEDLRGDRRGGHEDVALGHCALVPLLELAPDPPAEQGAQFVAVEDAPLGAVQLRGGQPVRVGVVGDDQRGV